MTQQTNGTIETESPKEKKPRSPRVQRVIPEAPEPDKKTVGIQCDSKGFVKLSEVDRLSIAQMLANQAAILRGVSALLRQRLSEQDIAVCQNDVNNCLKVSGNIQGALLQGVQVTPTQKQ